MFMDKNDHCHTWVGLVHSGFFSAEVVQNLVWKDPISPEGVSGGRTQEITEEQ